MNVETETQVNAVSENDVMNFVMSWREIIPEGNITFKAKTKFYVVSDEETTLAFIDKVNGDIYKPATNIARARGVRGNVLTNTVDEIVDSRGHVKHFRRGRPPKHMTPDSQEN